MQALAELFHHLWERSWITSEYCLWKRRWYRLIYAYLRYNLLCNSMEVQVCHRVEMDH